jgi:hypothetical protein
MLFLKVVYIIGVDLWRRYLEDVMNYSSTDLSSRVLEEYSVLDVVGQQF